MTDQRRTPLFDLHRELGAKMVPFAGYTMPVSYPSGILAEHRHTREAAGLFDISHMGQISVRGADVFKKLERVLPADLEEMTPGQSRYSFFLNDDGGVVDDLIVSRLGADEALLVVNGSEKETDLAWLRNHTEGLRIDMRDDRALLALQGPKAASVLQGHCTAPEHLAFMETGTFNLANGAALISRSGYTGEDGFEISLAASEAESLARQFLGAADVHMIGLGARDSLRLEAGLCLYGHDLTPALTPIEARLTWAIGKRRRREGGFIGEGTILEQLRLGGRKSRVGIKPVGRALAREGTAILDDQGRGIGIVTSGGFGASVDGPLSMGYLEPPLARDGSTVFLSVRGQILPAVIVALPFVPHRYFKGAAG